VFPEEVHVMKKVLFGLAVFGLLMSPHATEGEWRVQFDDERPIDWISDPTCQTIFFAVLEGCYTDGIANDTVDRILGVDAMHKGGNFNAHFVYCCPLCHPAYEAFRLYRRRQDFSGRKETINAFGGGLEPALERKLHSDKRPERFEALQTLITRWVALRLNTMRLTPQEREKWSHRMERRRKEGMMALEKGGGNNAGWKFCPTCDGSAGACKLKP
jgi:hypothetical protein